MAREIRFNERTKRYTLEPVDPESGEKTLVRNPPKFSGNDKYGKYRREAKKPEWKKQGLY